MSNHNLLNDNDDLPTKAAVAKLQGLGCSVRFAQFLAKLPEHASQFVLRNLDLLPKDIIIHILGFISMRCRPLDARTLVCRFRNDVDRTPVLAFTSLAILEEDVMISRSSIFNPMFGFVMARARYLYVYSAGTEMPNSTVTYLQEFFGYMGRYYSEKRLKQLKNIELVLVRATVEQLQSTAPFAHLCSSVSLSMSPGLPIGSLLCFTNLRNLGNDPYNVKSASELAHADTLESLSLGITYQLIDDLTAFASLKHLDLDLRGYPHQSINALNSALPAMRNIRVLNVWLHSADYGFSCANLPPNLQKLRIAALSNAIDFNGIDTLAHLQELKIVLDRIRMQPSPANLVGNSLLQLSALLAPHVAVSLSLHLGNDGASDSILEAIKSLNLRGQLTLLEWESSDHLSHEFLRSLGIGGQSQLRSITLRRLSIDELHCFSIDSLEAVFECPHLRFFSVDTQALSPEVTQLMEQMYDRRFEWRHLGHQTALHLLYHDINTYARDRPLQFEDRSRHNRKFLQISW